MLEIISTSTIYFPNLFMNLVPSEIWRPVASWVVPDVSKQRTTFILRGKVDQEDLISTCYIW